MNYELGRISSMKPIAILGMANDIQFLTESLKVPDRLTNYWASETVYTSIELETKIQSIEWHAFQYTGQDVALGGYNAAGNTLMRLDNTYLTNNIELHDTSDKPSMHIGTRKSTTISTAEIVQNVEIPSSSDATETRNTCQPILKLQEM